MRHSTLLPLLILFVCIGISFAQPALQWIHVWESATFDEKDILDCLPADDGGYLVCVRAEVSGENPVPLPMTVKFDAHGYIEWKREAHYNLTDIGDNLYGGIERSGVNYTFRAFDEYGRSVQEWTTAGYPGHSFFDLRSDGEGGYYVGGFRSESYWGQPEAIIYHLDLDGEFVEEWSHFNFDQFDNTVDWFFTSDDGFYIGGSIGTGVWAIHLSQAFDLVWETHYPNSIGQEFWRSDAVLTEDQLIIAAPRSHPQVTSSLLLLDRDNGNVADAKPFQPMYDVCLRQTSDGNFLIAGDEWVQRLDQVGNVLWTQQITAGHVKSVFETSPDQYLAFGITADDDLFMHSLGTPQPFVAPYPLLLSNVYTTELPADVDSVEFKIQIKNLNMYPTSLDAWLEILTPEDEWIVHDPVSMTLPAHYRLVRYRSVALPQDAPPGDYVVFVRTGQHPAIVHTDSFIVRKLPN